MTSDEGDRFLVESLGKDGTMESFESKAVVIAIGPSSEPNIPPAFASIVESDGGLEGPGWIHSAAFGKEEFIFPSRGIRTMVIIGGG